MASRPLVVHVVGARPNYMKVAPVYAALEQRGNVDQRLIHTGQHYDAIMKDVFFAELPLPQPHVAARTHRRPRTHCESSKASFAELRPELVVVAGDVNSTLAGAVAAAKCGITVCHIESGLRSGDWSMPEERNRVITDHLSTLLLTHSDDANKNLDAEALTARISFVGNTMIDTLRANEDAALALEAWREFGLEPGGYVLVTLHRPSLVDDPGPARPDDRGARRRRGDAAGDLPRASANAHEPRRIDARAPDGAAAVPAVSLARGEGGRGRDGLRRDPGRDDGAPRSLLHAARQHRAAGHDRARHEHAARARAGTLARGARAARRIRSTGRSRRSGMGMRENGQPRRSNASWLESRPEGLGGHDGVGARAGVPAADPAVARAGRRGRDHRTRLRADTAAPRAARPRSDGDRPPRRTFAARQGTLAHLASARTAQVGAAARVRPRARARLARADDDARGGSASRARRRTTTSSRRCSTTSACAPRRRWSCRSRSPPSGSRTSASGRRSCCAIPG